MLIPAGVKVHLALGYTDLRKGIDGLGAMVERVLEQDPFSGHLFVFRGKRADLIKVLFWDGTGLCLFTKRLDTADSPGRQRAGMGSRLRSRQHSCRCCWRGSIGASPSRCGGLPSLVEVIDQKALENYNKPLVETLRMSRIAHAPRPRSSTA